jgi:hypothetical protein
VATLGNPASPDSGRTPLYRTGFLRADAVVPVWELDRTRYSFGAEYWPIRSDGEQRCLSVYQGAGDECGFFTDDGAVAERERLAGDTYNGWHGSAPLHELGDVDERVTSVQPRRLS